MTLKLSQLNPQHMLPNMPLASGSWLSSNECFKKDWDFEVDTEVARRDKGLLCKGDNSVGLFYFQRWEEKVTNSKFIPSISTGNPRVKGTCNWEWVNKLETYRATFLWRSLFYAVWVRQWEKNTMSSLISHLE